MQELLDNVSQATVEVPLAAARKMVRLVKVLHHLSRDPLYRQHVYPQVPPSARFDPGHDAVMMCYDFHLVDQVPKLIEVNTNAGGSLMAYLAHRPSPSLAAEDIDARLRERLLKTFSNEMLQFSKGRKNKPERILILDENPKEQYLYPEMCLIRDLFVSWGVPSEIVAPEQLEIAAEGLFYEAKKVDFIYNRHCDFYLQSDAMAGLRDLYMAGKVCLSPNPHMYGLLADKRRMTTWSKLPQDLAVQRSAREKALLEETVLACSLLGELDMDETWAQRKQRIFKPVDSFASRGVLHGEKISRKRFSELPPESTLVQELAPPSMTEVAGTDPMKTDLRLYAYRDQVLGITARLYRGQVTNLRTPGGGFARVALT